MARSMKLIVQLFAFFSMRPTKRVVAQQSKRAQANTRYDELCRAMGLELSERTASDRMTSTRRRAFAANPDASHDAQSKLSKTAELRLTVHNSRYQLLVDELGPL